MKNLEISRIFRDIAKLLEIKGDNPFKIRAYERAAQNIEGLSEDIENFYKDNRLREIPGVGHDLAEKIQEFLKTNKLSTYENLKKTTPAGLLELLNIPSIGPKTAKLLYEKLKIKNLSDLEKAIKKGQLKNIFGIKEKTVENITKGIAILKRGKERLTLAKADSIAKGFIRPLRRLPEVKKISVAGSLRRRKETVRDIDILVISDKTENVIDTFTNNPLAKDILATGQTKSSLRTKNDVQVDCRIVEEKSFGAALLYFTGAKNFNIKLRQLAIKKGLKINEYGVFKKDKFIAGKTEEEIFKILGLDYIEPELREDRGEIELAKESKLPELIQLKDIRGDLHTHSQWSDGINSIEEMSLAAKKLGYSYIAITDHSESLKIAGGLTIPDLINKNKEIAKLNKRLADFKILYGTEADITSTGEIDYPDKVLKEFDLVVAAIHSGFKQTKEKLTQRIIKACRNKYVHIIAHPTGRLWGTRDPYELDLEEIFKVAADTNTAMEINAFADRLDLNDLNCRRAKEFGVKLAINTDSHTIEQLNTMKLGISVARRGWLSAKNVINTLPVEKLLKTIKK